MTIVLIRSVIIYLLVVGAVRIMGKRQIGELKPQELFITILISAVATIPLEDNAIPLSNSLLPILIFVSLEILQSLLSMKSLWFRNLIQGKPLFIIKDGVLQQQQLKSLRFTVDDLVDALRQKNAFDIAKVQNAVIETNGSVSVQLKAACSPVTPKDLKLKVTETSIPVTLVMDGKAVTEYFGGEKHALSSITLITQSVCQSTEELLLLTLDNSGNIYFINKEKQQ